MLILPISKNVKGLKSTADVCLSCMKLESDYSVGISRQKCCSEIERKLVDYDNTCKEVQLGNDQEMAQSER